MNSKKKIAKGFAKIIIFIIIFSMIFVGGSYLLLPKVKDDATGKPVNMITSCKVLDKNTVDVIILGDSDAYRGVNPMKIWMDQGITTCLIGHSFCTEPELYYRAVDILKHQQPKYMILETDCMFEDSNKFAELDEEALIDAEELIPDGNNEIDTESTDPFGIGKIEDKLSNFETGILASIDSRYPLMKFNYRWKQVEFDEIFQTSLDRAFTSRGYLTSNEHLAFEFGDEYMTNGCEPDSVHEIDDLTLEYFNKIVELCKDNDIELALLTVPTGYGWNWSKHNAITQLAEENGLSYIDYNAQINEVEDFDWYKDSKDGGIHLNKTGSSKVTNAYEKVLVDEYGLKPSVLTDEVRQKWNDDTAIFYEKNFKFPKEKTYAILDRHYNEYVASGLLK